MTKNNEITSLITQHDAICDVVVPPIGRISGLRTQMAGTSVHVNESSLDKDHDRQALCDELVEFFSNEFTKVEISVNTEINAANDLFYQMCVMSVEGDKKDLVAFVRYKNAGQNSTGNMLVASFDRALLTKVRKLLDQYKPKKKFTIKHVDIIECRLETSDYTLNESEVKLIPEFYPFIKDGPEQLITDFLESRDGVLILTGIQGTGKSSLFRNMLNYAVDSTFLIVDNPGIYQSADAFAVLVKFLRSVASQGPVIVALEEVDAFVKDKSSNNLMLPRLLNLSAGAVKSNIKFVLMSNLPSADQFSEALVRDGRTFAAIDFKRLSPEEASTARAAIGYPSVEFTKPEILATALKRNFTNTSSIQTGKIGFTNTKR